MTNAQARKLMKELQEHGGLGMAAARAGMHRNTARRYARFGALPAALKAPRPWRTREDSLAADWPELAARLAAVPELEAQAPFEDLPRSHPWQYESQLRALQRRVKQRGRRGPPQEVFFPQPHRAGEALQTTSCGQLRGDTRRGAFREPCCATRCCRTAIGSPRRSAARSRSWRCAPGWRRQCSSWGECPTGTRRATRP